MGARHSSERSRSVFPYSWAVSSMSVGDLKKRALLHFFNASLSGWFTHCGK